MEKTIQFGWLLPLDGYGGNPRKLNDVELVRRALNELPDLIHMKKLTEPLVIQAPGGNPKDSGGVTGMVVIAESHIAIHTFPGRGYARIELSTCQDQLDRQFVVDYFTEMFGFERLVGELLPSGVDFPAEDIHPESAWK